MHLRKHKYRRFGLEALAVCVLLLPVIAACGDGQGGPALLGPVDRLIDERPALVEYPDDYSEDKSYPLVIMLHGYSANSTLQDAIFGLRDQVTARQFILVRPEGTENPENKQFWNATVECCDFHEQGPDDVQYISDLIVAAKRHFRIDATRVALIGHSNGGYMANRYACEPIEPITRIVNLAGLSWIDADRCLAPQPVDVLHIHGTADETVPYGATVTQETANDGVSNLSGVGARALAQRWAQRAGCDSEPTEQIDFADLSSSVAGNESDLLTWLNCSTGSSDLIRANGVGHVWLDRTEAFQEIILDYLLRIS